MSHTQHTTAINWNAPEPNGAFDRFVGPGATNTELLLQIGGAVASAVFIVIIAAYADLGWTIVQNIVAAFLALDIAGGIITNATSSGKRWYHRAGQGTAQHMTFVALHVIQPLLVVVFFDLGNWWFVIGGYGYALIAASIILYVPLYLQRPIAGLLLAVGIALSLYVIPVPRYFEWFLPLYFIKLLFSHLLREEPYRPRDDVLS